MPRDGNDLYSKAAGTTAVANETITSTQFNSTIDDIVEDLNAPRPLSAGGTGATSASTARTALDVAQRQSSTTDTTAGRGLIVGGFGIGGSGISLSADINNAVYGGIYQVTTDTVNTPAATGPFGTVIVGRYNAAAYNQIFIPRVGDSTANPQLYTRGFRSSSGGVDGWSAWVEAYTTGNLLGTVSQTGGTPTGSVIQRGSNSNGEYVRFADGTQICTKTISGLSLACNNAFHGGFRTDEQTWTFPVTFSANVHGGCVAVTERTAVSGGFGTSLGTANATWYLTTVATQTAQDRSARLMAVGRWF
jgi:hypothetical protein